MAYQDHLVNHLKNKLDTIKSEHSVFHSVLDNFVTKVTDNVKAVIKVEEINYEKYKELSSSMEHVLNLLIQLRAEIQRSREGCNSINTDDVVETVYSRLSSELMQKDKEINSMLSNQRKEIEENIQRTSDEWFQKYKELTTHLDNLEVEAQNNFQKLSEQQNNTMVQQRSDSEFTNSKISEMSCEVQNLQDKVMHLNSTVAANETKMSEAFAKNSELLTSSLLEFATIEITKRLKVPIQKIKENSTKISKVEKKNFELEQRIVNSTDVMKRDISEISVKLQGFQKRLDTGSSSFAMKKQISEKNDAQIKKMNSELSEESKKNTIKQSISPADKSEEIEQISIENKRGLPSISPSDQITQQQRPNSVPNTPPPTEQYYHQALPQGFEYHQQPQHPYKAAYGSAINDSRTQGNSARVGPTQQAIPQGGSFYQQTNQGMRNPQPPPAQPAQQFAATTPNQGVPLYQPNPAPNYAGNIKYFQNGWPNQPLQQTAAPFEPQQRKKKVLEITDPNTGRRITEELFNKSHANEANEHHEEPPAATSNEQDMREQFTRLVDDRLKPIEYSSSAVSKTLSE